MKLNNGATIDDPNAWTPAFGPENSWTFLDKAKGDAIEPLAEEYAAMVKEAQAIMNKSMERYEAFARAESFLLNHAMVVPYSTDTDGYFVAKFNPFERPKNTDELFRGIRVLEEPLTEAQFLALYEEWVVGREESLKK